MLWFVLTVGILAGNIGFSFALTAILSTQTNADDLSIPIITRSNVQEEMAMVDLHLVVDEFKFRGYDATLEGGGAAIPFIKINLKSGQVATYTPDGGDNLDTWGGQVYHSEEDFLEGNDSSYTFSVQSWSDCELATMIVHDFILEAEVRVSLRKSLE
jgi:hypothetical protein